MALTPGTRIGGYEITGSLGAGGMGEVYRARDPRLGRDVAIKTLPEVFASDPSRLARFEREAQVLAALNHPHIAQIYALAQDRPRDPDGDEVGPTVTALVMELVEGETLADLLARGPIPLDEALPIAKQIAEALEAAHEQGIIHRDLKPANIKLTPDGVVKVLDFGLAKLAGPTDANVGADFSRPAISRSPTITSPALVTGAGMLLGTAAYMSPEQARGRRVDRRADIWAFGCVLYEMLAGVPPFAGDDVTQVLARVLEREPDFTLLPTSLPPSVIVAIQLCLRKDQRERIRDAGDLGLMLRGEVPLADPRRGVATDHPPPRSHALPWAVAAVAVVTAATVAWFARPGELDGGRAVTRSFLPAAPADAVSGNHPLERLQGGEGLNRLSRTALALSPTGDVLVFSGRRNGTQQLFARRIDRLESMALDGTDGGGMPFFSPDGRWVGFYANGELKKVPVAGGPAVTICKAVEPFGASWGAADTIVFAGTLGEALWQVPAGGGTPTPASQLSDDEFSHKVPSFLPDGRTVLFTSQRSERRWDDARVVVRSLDGGSQKVLIENAADARYAPTGHLIFLREATLMAVPFDLTRLEVTGAPVALLGNVMQGIIPLNGGIDSGAGQFAASNTGTLVYIEGGVVAPEERELVWIDRAGRETALPAAKHGYTQPRLSADDNQIAVFSQDQRRRVWLFDISRGALRSSGNSGFGSLPLLTPDGNRIAFADSPDGGSPNIYWMPLDGTSGPERLTMSSSTDYPAEFTPEGGTLLVGRGPGGRRDVMRLDLETRRLTPLLTTAASEDDATLSPDGKWLAYASNESGVFEIYVQPYPGPGARRQVTGRGGTDPAWSRGSRELFFVRTVDGSAEREQMYAVPISVTPTFSAGPERLLFETTTASLASGQRRGYDVTRDGQRFLATRTVDRLPPAAPSQFILVQNWFEELKRLVPVN